MDMSVVIPGHILDGIMPLLHYVSHQDWTLKWILVRPLNTKHPMHKYLLARSGMGTDTANTIEQ